MTEFRVPLFPAESSSSISETTFKTDEHVIYWGDAIDILKSRAPDKSVQLIFADPPYNIGKQFANFRDAWETEESYLS